MSVIHIAKSDEYYTPKSAFENIKHFIPNNMLIDPFNNSEKPLSLQSTKFLKELGFSVVNSVYNPHNKENDFFDNDGSNYDTLVSNCPFSIKKQVLNHLKKIDKPFILILPTSTINTQYFKEWFGNQIQLIIPKKRIEFNYYNNVTKSAKGNSIHCCFDCIYFCYKCNLAKDINFL